MELLNIILFLRKTAFVAAHKYPIKNFFSPDGDVLGLVIAKYDQLLLRDTSSMGPSRGIFSLFLCVGT